MESGSSYPLLAPMHSIPDDIVTALMAGAQHLGDHEIILRQPNLELLMPPPVSVVAMRREFSNGSIDGRRLPGFLLTAPPRPIAA